MRGNPQKYPNPNSQKQARDYDPRKKHPNSRTTVPKNLWDVECSEVKPAMTFDDILGEKYSQISRVLSLEGFQNPSPIQVAAITHGLEGKSIIAQSKSGTGKTIAFLTLIFSKIRPNSGFQSLVISPTRELSNQIYSVAFALNQHLPPTQRLMLGLFIGGLPISDDLSRIKVQTPDVVFGTVGRLSLLMADTSLNLSLVRLIVLDEADFLLKGKEFRKLFGVVKAEKAKRPLQICCYSATFDADNFAKYSRELMGNLVKINNDCLVKNLESAQKKNLKLVPLGEEQEQQLEEPQQTVEISGSQNLNLDNLRQYLVTLHKPTFDESAGMHADSAQKDKSVSLQKMEWLVSILSSVEYHQCIIFYNDKGRGDQILAELRERDVSQASAYFHGDLSQSQRIKLMNKIKLKYIRIILATDVVSFV